MPRKKKTDEVEVVPEIDEELQKILAQDDAEKDAAYHERMNRKDTAMAEYNLREYEYRKANGMLGIE